MSTTKPPAGYDDRFVVPLEPSRRGAHRARVSPVIGVLPVVAVIAVVVVVVVLAWTLLGNSGGDSSGTTAATGVATSAPATEQAQQTGQAAPSDTVSTPPASSDASATGGATTTPASTVDKTVTVTVLNSTSRNGLARKVATTLTGKGWTAAHFATTPKVAARTTTTVFYATTAQKAVADALVADLGIGTVRKSAQFGTAGVTVVLGSDYPA
jgi:hypothetical protein